MRCGPPSYIEMPARPTWSLPSARRSVRSRWR